MVQSTVNPPIAELVLNDPLKRNALGLAMFDALEGAVSGISGNDSVHIVLLRGAGEAFCAGFDLAAAQRDPHLMARFIHRLSQLNRDIRRMPQVVVASVHGAAIAGGCAILSACDFVFVADDARLGYPVHRLGISPAVTLPTLVNAIGSGPARWLLMSGEIIDGSEAARLGLASRCSSGTAVLTDARAHCAFLAAKGPFALRTTKAWLNELDGSLDDHRFEGPALGSAELAQHDEARSMLANWRMRSAGR